MSKQPMRITYLEDDPDQAALVMLWLRDAGHECSHFETGSECVEAVLASSADALPDLLLLDWQLPDLSGEAVMKAVRERFAEQPPIVFFTAHDEAADLLRVLAAGADDHILKPITQEDFQARINAFAPTQATHSSTLTFAPYTFDCDARVVHLKDRPVKLDDAEFDVALSLFRGKGRVVTLPVLATHAARASGAEPDIRAAQGCVARVRAKLRLTAASGWQLRTVTDVGFRLESMR